jgi:predicted RNA-binding Zn-ribbon protein involved in translation (DUF1610 family)
MKEKECMKEIEVRMKCAACGYTGSSEEDFISNLFLSTVVHEDEFNVHHLSRIEGWATRIFACPKCGTLKIMTPEDRRNPFIDDSNDLSNLETGEQKRN